MKPRRGLVQDVERAPRVALRQLRGEFDALALTARQRRAGLPERQVAEAHLLNGPEFLVDIGDVLEKLHGHVDRHVQHVVDIFALVLHFERLAVVAVAAARLAAHVDVGQEVHLDGLHARPAALLAAAALDVERETPGLEAADLGVGRHLEQLADVGKDVRIGRGIRPRSAPDGRLVDNDQFVDMFEALRPVVLQRLVEGAVKLSGENRPQGFVDERRLARAADARHADELAQRKFRRDVLEVVAPRAADHDAPARSLAQRFGNFDPPASRQVIGGDGVGPEDVVERPGGHDVAALAPGAGSHVDDEVGGAHHVLVVLDDDHRVARVAQLFEAADQPLVIALVQADRRFVEDIEHVDEFRADLRGEADALALAARQRTRRTRQREVAQPHVHQEPQAFADLLDDLLGNLPLFLRELFFDGGNPLRELGNRHGRHLGDVLPGDAELQRLLPQARTAADRTFAVDEELVAPLLAVLRIVVLGAADVLGHALPREELASARRRELLQVDRQRLGIAVKHGVQRLLGETFDRIVEREIVTAAQHLQNGEKHVVAVLAQRSDGPFAQREAGIGNDLPHVENRLLAQSVAMGAGALGRVEREGVRRGVLEGHARRGAHQVARVETLLPGPVVVDGHRALALAHRLLQRGHQPFAGLLADHEAVDHQVDGVYLVAVEAHARRYFADLAVDARIDVPLLGQRLEQFAVVALAALDDGGHQGDLTPGETRENQLGDLVVGIVDHLLARHGRIGPRRPRVKQAQEVVDLGHGAHRRAGILVGRLLFDGHHGA